MNRLVATCLQAYTGCRLIADCYISADHYNYSKRSNKSNSHGLALKACFHLLNWFWFATQSGKFEKRAVRRHLQELNRLVNFSCLHHKNMRIGLLAVDVKFVRSILEKSSWSYILYQFCRVLIMSSRERWVCSEKGIARCVNIKVFELTICCVCF